MRGRSLALAGTALAVLALALPWRVVPGTLSYLTSGYYTNTCYYDYFGTYVCDVSFTPGVIVPGLPDGTYPGGDTVLRFYVAAAILIALWWGLHVGNRKAFRWAAYVLLGGALMSNIDGLTGGVVAVFAAVVCFWLAGRTARDTDVMRTEQAVAPSV